MLLSVLNQEIGIELAFEVLQFGFGTAVLQLLPGRLGTVPASRHPDSHAGADDQQVEDGVSGEKPQGVLPRPHPSRTVPRVGRT